MSIPSPASWPVRVAPLGPVSMGSSLWRHNGQLFVTAIVKATFGLSIDQEMACVAPEPVRRSDECARGVPSLRGASEVAPRMLQVDVMLHGHAYAPPGTTRSRVRLAVERDGVSLIDKTLLVVGKRKRQGDEPAPFERMRIGYERALGGIEFPDNPIGVGADDDALPTVLHPDDPYRRVAGLGPIPSRFPARRKLRGKVDLARIEHGIAEYPADFSWSYFQCAPPDQRLEQLRGDEWIVLEGLHPKHPRIRSRLPAARAAVRAYPRSAPGPGWPLEVRPDTVLIEADEARCSVVWRGAFAVASELAAEQMVLAGNLELPGRVLSWPADASDLEQLASPELDPNALYGRVDDDLQRTAVRQPGPLVPPAPPSVPSVPGSAVRAAPLAHTELVADDLEESLDDTAPVAATGDEDHAPFPIAPARRPARSWDRTANLDLDIDVEILEEVDAVDDMGKDGDSR